MQAAPKLVEPAAPESPAPPSVGSGIRPVHTRPGAADAPVPEEQPLAMSTAAKSSPWVLSTYFAEGLPYSIVHQVAAQLFTAMGASLSAIGLTSLYGLAWNLKFAWSPLVERVGTTRRWLIGLELALGLAIIAVAFPAERGDLGTVARMLVAVAFLAATHDIAIDGFYLRALEKREQTALSGLRIGAYRIALLVGNGVLVWLAGKTSWLWCFAAAGALLLGLAALHSLVLPAEEPEGDPAIDGAVAARPPALPAIYDAFVSFFRQPGIAVSLAFILTFRAGDAMMFAMSTPLLRDLGLDTAARGLLSGIAGTAASIVGSVLGGAFIARRGFQRTLTPIATMQSLAILLYAWMAWAHAGTLAVAAVVIVEQLVAGVGTAAFLVFLMRRCSAEHKVSHYAIASALMSVATTGAGSASGYLAAHVGFATFFVLAWAASVPGVVLSRWVPKE